mgnify:CR=1 FL=1
MIQRRGATSTTAFGVGRRENHDSSSFYSRFTAPVLSDDDVVVEAPDLGDGCLNGDARDMHQLPDSSVALVVTSPPYFVGKDYELEMERDGVPTSYLEYLEMLRDVFAECVRVLEPGGRIAVNVANLGRKPYRSLSADVIRILQDELGLLLRGEVVWQKAEGATGSVAWGSFRRAANPVLRDMTERVVIASKGRFDRARTAAQRQSDGLPSESTITTDEFMEATLDVWRIDAEQASRVGHPAPFPVELPRRLIDLYTYRDDMVLDPFLGSGTTLVAAQRAGRRGVGYDLDPAYVTLAKQRLEDERRRLEEVRPEAWRRRDLSGDSATQGGLFEAMDGPTGEGQRATDHLLTRATASGKKVADIAEAHARAHACDPVSAFGGVIAANRPVSVEMARQVAEVFTEVIVAPGYEDGAVDVLQGKKNIRILVCEDLERGGVETRPVSGGLLMQQRDSFQAEGDDPSAWTLATGEAASPEVLADLAFAWRACRSAKSNAILLAKDGASVGIGMGQVNRVDSCKLAVERANSLAEGTERARGAVAASDAFFPFEDGPQVLIDAGVTAIVQPGGSVRDELTIEACKAAGVTMYFTGTRHFFH